MGHQNLQLPNLIAWPPPKPPPAQPLLAEPKSLAVIDQDLDRRASFVTKYKQQSRERIRLQHFPAYPGQAINAPAKVHRLHRHPDLHLRTDLDHHPCLQKARPNSTGSKSLGVPLKDILIFAPLGASISTRHSEGVIGAPRSSLTKPKSGRCPTAKPISLVALGTRFFRPL